MRNTRNIFTIFFVLILSFFMFMSRGNAADVPPTSTIGSINGPGDVGTTTIPTDTTTFVDECMYIGDPVWGQTEYGLTPCLLDQTTTTTQVAVDIPPVPGVATKLPQTGSMSGIIIVLGFTLIGVGVGLLRVRRHL